MSAPGPSSSHSLTALEVAEKFQLENPEQFRTLVLMHLTFVLDLPTTDEIAPEKEIKEKTFNIFSKKVKEGHKEDHDSSSQNIFKIIKHLDNEENLCEEGIFRRTGSLVRQRELKNLIYSCTQINEETLESFSVHDCASVLKRYLADLPEPLLTDAHYAAHLQIAEIFKILSNDNTGATKTRLLHALQLLTLLLPESNKTLLKQLLGLLRKTASFEKRNKMSANNLAILFTPHLLCPKNLDPEEIQETSHNLKRNVSFLIRNEGVMTDIPIKLLTDIRAFLKQNMSILSPESATNNTPVFDNSEAHTVYTFIDVKKTNEAQTANTTEQAIAELYAYVQKLPDSSKKRKLVKKFNKHNEQGRPFQILKQEQLDNLRENSHSTSPVVLPGPPLTPRSPRLDLEGLSEKYWGEILERTVSSSSLHALQKVYGRPICRPSGFNGTLSRSMGSHPMI